MGYISLGIINMNICKTCKYLSDKINNSYHKPYFTCNNIKLSNYLIGIIKPESYEDIYVVNDHIEVSEDFGCILYES